VGKVSEVIRSLGLWVFVSVEVEHKVILKAHLGTDHGPPTTRHRLCHNPSVPAFRTFDPSGMSMREQYDLLVAAIVPRPIALVSTVDGQGNLNLAPFSFFMAGGARPLSLAFSPTLNLDGTEKHTLRNIRESQEFVVNTVHRDIVREMNAASGALPAEVSEWGVGGLTPVPSERVRPPRVAESLVQLECRLFEVVEHGEGAGAARYVVGEVVQLHFAEALFSQGVASAAPLVARLGGPNYVDLGEVDPFPLERPS
jgi:flavin reductase (DIM6/NTAB) family NADH-FMN oxidoreductase RutF